MTRLEELLDKSSQLVLPAIEESVSVAAYVESLKEVIAESAITEEADQVSLVSTLVCYIHSNREGLPNHSMVYMDRITLLRGKIEEHYQTRAERFCGSDVCMG